MTGHQRWTNTDLIDLRRRLLERATAEQIAEAVGRTPDAVMTMMKRLRLREAQPR